jgi:hypothetical protein
MPPDFAAPPMIEPRLCDHPACGRKARGYYGYPGGRREYVCWQHGEQPQKRIDLGHGNFHVGTRYDLDDLEDVPALGTQPDTGPLTFDDPVHEPTTPNRDPYVDTRIHNDDGNPDTRRPSSPASGPEPDHT